MCQLVEEKLQEKTGGRICKKTRKFCVNLGLVWAVFTFISLMDGQYYANKVNSVKHCAIPTEFQIHMTKRVGNGYYKKVGIKNYEISHLKHFSISSNSRQIFSELFLPLNKSLCNISKSYLPQKPLIYFSHTKQTTFEGNDKNFSLKKMHKA